jgi:nicotinamidase-related amidase
MRNTSIFPSVVIFLLIASPAAPAVDDSAQIIPNRPKVPGVLRLHLQERRETTPKSGEFKLVERTVDWDVAETAIIICDMWDDHWCKSCAQRVAVMAPKMNGVITAARNHGVMIIHAPSDTMDRYADTPYRKRMQQARTVTPPVPILKRCTRDESKEPALPIDVSKSDCDDPIPGHEGNVHSREHPGLDITGFDGISDKGEEIFNFCQQEGIKNIALMGVHANYCILARSFGVRQLTRLGMNVVLVRDLTDAMYDPRQPPFVSHTRGTELVIEHIEKYWCPSVLSEDMTRVVAGSDDPKPGGH